MAPARREFRPGRQKFVRHGGWLLNLWCRPASDLPDTLVGESDGVWRAHLGKVSIVARLACARSVIFFFPPSLSPCHFSPSAALIDSVICSLPGSRWPACEELETL